MNGLYKRRYGIGIYKRIRKVGDTDELVELFDNAEEFANFIGKSIKKARDILSSHFKHKADKLVCGNRMYDIAFIDMLEE